MLESIRRIARMDESPTLSPPSMTEPIKIEQAESLEGIFNCPGVWLALDYVFRNPEGIVPEDSRTYAELTRAYWALPDYSSVVRGREKTV